MATGALGGVRIVEFGQLIAIPFATKLLADMGAEVIRVESCTRLELYRASGFYDNDPLSEWWNRSVHFYEQNRNKQSLTLDLTKPEGRSALLELVSVSDVFAENFTPRVIRNFGLEYEDLRKVRPDIIMVSSTGYGHTGPWSGFGAIGFGTEAASGLSSVTGYRDGPPAIPEIPYSDFTAGEHTAFAIMTALVHRAASGRGQFIDISQTQTLSATVPEALMDYAFNGRTPARSGNRDDNYQVQGTYPCRGIDNWISITIRSDSEWESLCEVLGRNEWTNDGRFSDHAVRRENHDLLDGLIADSTRNRDSMELQSALQAAGVPAGAALDGKGLLFNEHLAERGFYEVVEHPADLGMPALPYPSRPWKFSGTPGTIRSAAPKLGEHNRAVLGDMLGWSKDRVGTLEESGVIGTRPVVPRAPSQPTNEMLMQQGLIVRSEPDFKDQVRERFG